MSEPRVSKSEHVLYVFRVKYKARVRVEPDDYDVREFEDEFSVVAPNTVTGGNLAHMLAVGETTPRSADKTVTITLKKKIEIDAILGVRQ